ncbi:THO complex subunit 3 [Cichlidogyrus casuarinus]|uniref:THO complex subunit 3 n=1 Tax=Cichlidogyrus casuarinus TaxID=1844966 RepID=A0ABD2PXK9_9PLAT
MFSKYGKSKDIPMHSGKINSFAWNVNASKFATGHLDKLINVFSIEQGRVSKTGPFKGHTDIAEKIVWHPSDPELFSSAGADGCVKLWDCRTKKCAQSLQMKSENINLAWSPDSRCIAVGNKSDVLTFHDPRMQLNILQTESFNYEVNEFGWMPSTSKHKDLFLITTGQGSVLVY